MTDCIFTVTGATIQAICFPEDSYWQTHNNDDVHLHITVSNDNVRLKVSASRILTCRRADIEAIVTGYERLIADKTLSRVEDWGLSNRDTSTFTGSARIRICGTLAELFTWLKSTYISLATFRQMSGSRNSFILK